MTDTLTTSPAQVIHQSAGQGETTWFGDAIYTFKATAESTNGSLTLAEATVPPGGGPPPHIHPKWDESFIILAGEIEFLNGTSTFVAGQGDYVFVPRGTRHRFRNVGLQTARLIFFFTPGAPNMESFFAEIGTPARRGEAPPPLTKEQVAMILNLAPKHDLLLAPNP